MASKNKPIDIIGENKDDGETRKCKEKANIRELIAYASPPSRWKNAHGWEKYYKAHAEAVAVKRGRAEKISFVRDIQKTNYRK